MSAWFYFLLLKIFLKKVYICIFSSSAFVIPIKRIDYETKLLPVGLVNVVVRWLHDLDLLTLSTPTISFELFLQMGFL